MLKRAGDKLKMQHFFESGVEDKKENSRESLLSRSYSNEEKCAAEHRLFKISPLHKQEG